MEPQASPQDIGSVIAVFGTKGWQCCLCNSTFPRSFSMEHHMISHHPVDKQVFTPLSSNNPPQLGLSRQTNVHQNQAQGDSSQNLHAASLASSPSQTVVESQCNMREGSTVIKTESNMDMTDLNEGSSDQEVLPVYFDRNPVQQNVISVSDVESRNSPRQGSSTIHDVGGEGMQHGQRVQSCHGPTSHAHCSFTPCERTDCSCAQQWKRRHGRGKGLKGCKRHTCSCGLEFESKHDFKFHRRVTHCQSGHKVFVCPICDAQYLYKRGLNRHLAEKGSKPVQCSNCSKKFHNQILLKEHRKFCHSPQAQDPGLSTTDGIRIQDNAISQEHNKSVNAGDLAGQQRIGESFPWECSKCKTLFIDELVFHNHLSECGILVQINGKTLFSCNLCGACFEQLVHYHKHYINEHKLVFCSQPSSSPACSSPFTGNSPVPSPAPSVTSEINTAMAGVSLNQSNTLDLKESSISFPCTIDLTSDTGYSEHLERQCRNEEAVNSLNSTQNSQVAASNTSDPSLLKPTRCSSIPLLPAPTAGSVDLISFSSATSSSDPQSFTSCSSSDPASTVSTVGSSGPDSVPTSSLNNLQETRKKEHVITESDMEDSQSNDSCSDSEEDWEVIRQLSMEGTSDVKEECVEPQATQMKEDRLSNSPPKQHQSASAPPPPEYNFPPPPHPHFFPPPPHGFPPPPRPPFHHHHDPRFGHGRPFGGRGMHGPWGAFFGAARFGFGNWFCPEMFGSDSHSSDDSKTNAGFTSAAKKDEHRPAETSGTSGDADNSQSGKNMRNAAFGQEHSSDFSPFCHSANLHKWNEDKKYMKVMWKKVFCNMLKSCQQNTPFLFCPDCLQTFSEESDLEKHAQENHPTSQEYICFLCQEPHSQALAFNQHIKRHCETFMLMNSHRGRGRSRGWGRGWGRGRGGGLMGFGRGIHHIMKWLWKTDPYGMFSSHHGDPCQEAEKDNNPGSTAPEDVQECPVCKKQYQTNSRVPFFERHVCSHNDVEVYNFECEECGKKFLEKGKFTAHQAKHKASQFVCKVCDKVYQSGSSLKRHEMTHTGERPHKCPECGEGFIELRQLERHRTKHTGQLPFQCKVCGRGFTLKDSIMTHIRKQHPDKILNDCIQRAMTLPEADQHRKANLEREESSVGSIKSEPQHPSDMEMD